MTIHQKVNAKGNMDFSIQMLRDYPEMRMVMLPRLIKRGYSKFYDQWLGERLRYPQDRKTNYREPKSV